MRFIIDDLEYIQDRLDFLYSLLPFLTYKDRECVESLIQSYEKILKIFY